MAVTQCSASMTAKVVEKVAERKGVDATDLTQPLGKVIDPDTLDNLAQFDSGYVQFEYAGYRVNVFTDGCVELTQR